MANATLYTDDPGGAVADSAVRDIVANSDLSRADTGRVTATVSIDLQGQ